jgi:hypothetical protein
MTPHCKKHHFLRYREHQLEAERDRNLSGVTLLLLFMLQKAMSLMQVHITP